VDEDIVAAVIVDLPGHDVSGGAGENYVPSVRARRAGGDRIRKKVNQAGPGVRIEGRSRPADDGADRGRCQSILQAAQRGTSGKTGSHSAAPHSSYHTAAFQADLHPALPTRGGERDQTGALTNSSPPCGPGALMSPESSQPRPGQSGQEPPQALAKFLEI